jgi:hypothetical protein
VGGVGELYKCLNCLFTIISRTSCYVVLGVLDCRVVLTNAKMPYSMYVFIIYACM